MEVLLSEPALSESAYADGVSPERASSSGRDRAAYMREYRAARKAKKSFSPVSELPSDDELKLEIRKTLIEVMRNATKERRISYECDQHPKYKGDGRGYKHQINVPVEDYGSIIRACGELLDRMEGKAATKRDVPKPKVSGRRLEELSDEELEALMEVPDGEVDGGAAEEAA